LNSPALVVPSAARYVAMLAVWYEGAATVCTTGDSRVIYMRVVQRGHLQIFENPPPLEAAEVSVSPWVSPTEVTLGGMCQI
jgi:hypothetical protein